MFSLLRVRTTVGGIGLLCIENLTRVRLSSLLDGLKFDTGLFPFSCQALAPHRGFFCFLYMSPLPFLHLPVFFLESLLCADPFFIVRQLGGHP